MEASVTDLDRLPPQDDTIHIDQPAVDTLEPSEPSTQPEHDMPANTEETLANAPHSYNNGFNNSQSTSQTSVDYAQSAPAMSSHEGEFSSRISSPTMSYQQLQPTPQLNSRPGSAGVSSGGDRYGYSQSHSDQNPRPQAGPPSKNSVVIKVGMVGDAQIGKTSLMVKYVEGSWDEDYIQTLGKGDVAAVMRVITAADLGVHRGELHGEDDLDPKHRNNIFDLGSWWAARVCQHASLGLQRRSRHSLHVRPDAQKHT